jgi:hypothetical protein
MDRRGLPVADGTVVTLVSPANAAQKEAAVRDGAVDFALEICPARSGACTSSLRAAARVSPTISRSIPVR